MADTPVERSANTYKRVTEASLSMPYANGRLETPSSLPSRNGSLGPCDIAPQQRFSVGERAAYWAGWNDARRDKSKRQTERLSEFMQKYLTYGAKECLIAIHIWRHKLLHTGEPRKLRNADVDEAYWWGIDTDSPNPMVLVPLDASGNFSIQVDPFALLRDLRNGVLGPGGYMDDLRYSADLQQKFLRCFNEMDSYKISIKL